MKTIIAVTFIGILTYALDEKCSETELTECNKPAMADFDSDKYSLFMPAFATHSRYGTGVTVCRVFKSVTISCDTVETDVYGYYQHSGRIYQYKMLCITFEEDYRKGQFWATCKIVKDSYYGNELIITPFKLYMSVVDTDYENYAIFYTCIKDKTGVEDNYEVLQKNPPTGDEPAKGALEKIKMKLEDFKHRNVTYCQNGIKEDKKET
uniref:Putative triabin lipocalin n=1 Tax=Panstrongylus lignarius TaxID=156445 RepID=A0A224XY31_9HEMI